MADIVENLRSLSRYEHADLSVGDEAADEIERLRNALAFMKGAVDSCTKPTAYPHRVVFKDGFVIEGRAANEWFNLLTVLRDFCSRYLDGEKGSTRLAKLEAVAEAARDALAFLKGIEGSGYGGTSEYDVLVVNLGHGLAALDGENE